MRNILYKIVDTNYIHINQYSYLLEHKIPFISFYFLFQSRHGDILYLKKTDSTLIIGSAANNSGTNSPFSSVENISRPGSSKSVDSNSDSINEKTEIPIIPEDEIDVILSHESGLINRKRHPQL